MPSQCRTHNVAARSSGCRGFTLLELMIVLVIASILLLIALPAYQQQVVTGSRKIAAATLLEAMSRQEQFFVEHKRFARNLGELGYPYTPYAVNRSGEVLAGHDPGRVYLIELSTQARGYTLSGAPQLGQRVDHACGTIKLDAIGRREITGTGTVAQCW